MTNGEIALAVIAACFAAYGLLMSFGNYFDRRRFDKQVLAAQAEVESAKTITKLTSRGWHKLDQGVGRAIVHIIKEHSNELHLRYAHEGDPSHYYGSKHRHVAGGLLRALNILEVETGRYKEEKEDPSPAYLRALSRHKAYEVEAMARRHGPVMKPCAVCGCHASTYRWGQCISVWSSETGIRSTNITTRWQEFDPRFEAGWVPVCTFHAATLDNGRALTRRSKGYHQHG